MGIVRMNLQNSLSISVDISEEFIIWGVTTLYRKIPHSERLVTLDITVQYFNIQRAKSEI